VEIDMGGEVARPGRFERVGIFVGEDRLERVAGARPVVAVIDDQRRPALAGEAAGEIGGDRQRDGRAFGLDRAVANEAAAGEGDAKLAVRAELADRQGVEEFVGDGEQRAGGGKGGEIVVPARRDPLGLGGAAARWSRPARPAASGRRRASPEAHPRRACPGRGRARHSAPPPARRRAAKGRRARFRPARRTSG